MISGPKRTGDGDDGHARDKVANPGLPRRSELDTDAALPKREEPVLQHGAGGERREGDEGATTAQMKRINQLNAVSPGQLASMALSQSLHLLNSLRTWVKNPTSSLSR